MGEGLNSSFRVGPLWIDGLTVVAPGGGKSSDAKVDPPIQKDKYQPRYDGARPSWGFFVRHAEHVYFSGAVLSTSSSDGRPAIVMDDVHGAKWIGGKVNAGAGCQLQLRDVSDINCSDTRLASCKWQPKDYVEELGNLW